ncbi:MAG: hypothetical protein PHI86_00135 [Candidatus Omnitrophica bacterium]|nr:hypothetical protein [Candidatus Omnitrophota bacterium]
MTREEIYEHLAQVYLGKKTKKKKKYNFIKVILFANLIAITLLPSFYLFNSKTSQNIKKQEQSFSLSLNYYPLRFVYNFKNGAPQVENFSLHLPTVNVTNYDSLVFYLRGKNHLAPRILKIALENKKKEKSVYYFDKVEAKWQKITIPLKEFKDITDWTNITKVSFIIEAWNTDETKGSVLIDDVHFYAKGGN